MSAYLKLILASGGGGLLQNRAVAPALTLYYSPQFTENWDDISNWFVDDEFTIQAAAIPTSGDDVVITGTANFASPVFVRNLRVEYATLSLTITASGTAEFVGGALSGTLTGNATFRDSSYIAFGGQVVGDAVFEGFTYSEGTVTGNANFGDYSVNYFGSVQGTATFTDFACNEGGTAGTFVPDPPPSCF